MIKRFFVWLLCICAAVLLYLFENNSGTRAVLILALAVPLLSILIALLSAKRVRVSIHMPDHGEQTVPLPISVRVRNVPPMTNLRGQLKVENRLTGESLPYEFTETKAVFQIESASCGALECSVSAELTDLFGILRRSVPSAAESACMVAPMLFDTDLQCIEDADNHWGNLYSDTKPGQDPSETFSIREYLPGDPVRQIHWKLSQKIDKTMLRELGLPISNRTLLLFDACGVSDPRHLSGMAEAFFSLSRAMLSSGIEHTLCWKHRDFAPVFAPILSNEDYAAALPDFFSGRPELAFSTWSSSAPEFFSHVAAVCAVFPPYEDVSQFGGRITVFSPSDGAPTETRYHAIPFDSSAPGELLSHIEF